MRHAAGATPMLRQLKLLRWLGPWTSATARPTNVRREAIAIAAEGRSFEGWLYRIPEREPLGAYLLAPGLHPDGPADDRLDRFATILAATGYLVLSPFIEDYCLQEVTPRAVADFEASFEALLARPELPSGARPRIFTVSFGSLLGLRLAASERHADDIERLIVFGGYADWSTTLRYTLTGDVDGVIHGSHDKLNQPVAFINILDALPEAPADPGAQRTLKQAWVEFARTTWGDDEMQSEAAFGPLAERMARGLPEEHRELFLLGCRVRPGGEARCIEAIGDKGEDYQDFVNPIGQLEGIRCPVYIIHGADDDVIPVSEAHVLEAALPAHVERHLLLTGLYGHTQTGPPSPLDLLKEVSTLLRMMNAL